MRDERRAGEHGDREGGGMELESGGEEEIWG